MIAFCLVLVVRAAWSAPADLEGCEYCRQHSARCEAGQVVVNSCVRCVCADERRYECAPVSPACDDKQESATLSKPTEARCEPRVIYVLNSVTCMCSKNGYWPHDKCEIAFKNLHNFTETGKTKTETGNTKQGAEGYKSSIKKTLFTNYYPSNWTAHHSSSDTAKKLAGRCDPNSYLIQDCNVCRCNARGVVARCTKNDCSKKVAARRAYDRVQGSCVPNNWYLLAPCQFCRCQQANKLVCSTRPKDLHDSFQLGAYNLTDCGKDLANELFELAPDMSTNLLRQSTPYMSPEATTTSAPLREGHVATDAVSNGSHDDTNDDDRVENPSDIHEYETEEEDGVVKKVTESLEGIQNSLTLGPLDINEDSNEISILKKNPTSVVQQLDGNYKPYYESSTELPSLMIPTQEPPLSLVSMLSANGLPKDMINMLSSMPEVSQLNSPQSSLLGTTMKDQNEYDLSIKPVHAGQQKIPGALRINLPKMLDRIIEVALRKSMVKIDNSRTCLPGATSQDGCNYCYCLVNGKQLCTDKKTC